MTKGRGPLVGWKGVYLKLNTFPTHAEWHFSWMPVVQMIASLLVKYAPQWNSWIDRWESDLPKILPLVKTTHYCQADGLTWFENLFKKPSTLVKFLALLELLYLEPKDCPGCEQFLQELFSISGFHSLYDVLFRDGDPNLLLQQLNRLDGHHDCKFRKIKEALQPKTDNMMKNIMTQLRSYSGEPPPTDEDVKVADDLFDKMLCELYNQVDLITALSSRLEEENAEVPDAELVDLPEPLVEDQVELDIENPEECVVCQAGKNSHIIVPCGHQILCQSCAKKKLPLCPVCRLPIKQIIRVFKP